MKQLNKIQTFIFILGGVLMVIGAGCFAFGYMIYPQLTFPLGHGSFQCDAIDATL